VAAHLHPGIVLRTTQFDGASVRNHAKFLAIDHRFMLVTSANFSWSAEHGNVELGVLADNTNLVQAIESQMRRVEESLYERVEY
jgi:phosphatidylserine/phosphatidylglycerophosphate/cardiolipin synthase-like enzyme